jgi:hypothetical protein
MKEVRIKKIRTALVVFMTGLFLSGLTAIPLIPELSWLLSNTPEGTSFYTWLQRVLIALEDTQEKYPFVFYGFDWLAFAHFILAILFIGPYRDPVKNIWVLQFGLISCVLVFPLAFLAGYFRGIPIGWQLIDCSFGLAGFVILWYCYKKSLLISMDIQTPKYDTSTEKDPDAAVGYAHT